MRQTVAEPFSDLQKIYYRRRRLFNYARKSGMIPTS